MLHRLNTIDYGSRQAGSSAADDTEKYYPLFFLDFLSIVGLPLKAITRVNGDVVKARSRTGTCRTWRSTSSRCRST
jgi:hypothetical protein